MTAPGSMPPTGLIPDQGQGRGRLVLLAGALLCLLGIVSGLLTQGRVPLWDLLPAAPGGHQAPDATIPSDFRATFQGTLLDHQGAPIGEALVTGTLLRPGGPDGPGQRTVTNAHGQFVLTVTSPGPYLLVISAKGRARQVHRRNALTAMDHHLGELRLGRDAPIRGLVLSAAGTPIEGALISAMSAFDVPTRPLEPPHRALSDANGRFTVSGLMEGVYHLQAEAPGHGIRVAREVMAPTLDVRFSLRPLRHITGRVLLGDAPAPGAVATLVGSGAWPPRRVLANDRGEFRFEGVAEGLYQLRARRDTWISAASEPVDVLGDNAVPEVVLRLRKGVFIAGKITDADTKQGLAGARLVVARESLDMDPELVTSRGEGRFRLGPLLPGEYLFTVEREGYLPRQAEPLTLLPGENPALEVALKPGAVLAGQVIDDTGRPVPEARIELVGRALGSHIADRDLETSRTRDALWNQLLRSFAEKPSWGVTRAAQRQPVENSSPGTVAPSLGVMQGPVPLVPGADTQGDLTGAEGLAPAAGYAQGFVTDKDGRFSLRGVPPGTLALVVRHADFVRHRTEPFRLARGDAKREILIRLRPGTTLLGEVLGPVEMPLANVQVSVAPEGDPFYQTVQMSDPDGAFTLKHLEGRVRLELRMGGFLTQVHRIQIDPDPDRPQRVRFTLEPAQCELTGHLQDSQKLPVAGARITAQSLSPEAPSRAVALSNEQGTFTLSGLGRLMYALEVAHGDYPTHQISLTCPSSPSTHTLSFGGGLAFEVLDHHVGSAVPRFQYTLSRPGAPAIRQEGSAGAATLVPLAEGHYTLTVRAAAYAPATVKLNVPGSTEPRQVTRRDVVVKLLRAGRVAGWVRDDRGLAVEGATVEIAEQKALTDARGRFLINDVPGGSHALTATHPERGQGTIPEVAVKGDLDTVDLVVDLTPGATDPKKLVASLDVQLRDHKGRAAIASVAPRSTAERGGLAPGDLLLSVDDQDLDGLGIHDVLALLRGVAGTPVVLELRRGDRRLRLSVPRELLDR